MNGLAYCAQEVISAMEAMQEAAVGAAPARPSDRRSKASNRNGSQPTWKQPRSSSIASGPQPRSPIVSRRSPQDARSKLPHLEELEQSLTVLEEKLFAILLTTTPEAELLALRQQAAAELAPYRSRMPAMQIRQVEQQFLHKRLLEKFNLPRLSLFYMSQA